MHERCGSIAVDQVGGAERVEGVAGHREVEPGDVGEVAERSTVAEHRERFGDAGGVGAEPHEAIVRAAHERLRREAAQLVRGDVVNRLAPGVERIEQLANQERVPAGDVVAHRVP